MNQNCAEHMLMNAAKRVLGVQLQFQYDEHVEDIQADIMLAFLGDTTLQRWFSGRSADTLQADLVTLNRRRVYFLRTGTGLGAGHWQMLYYDSIKEGWINYSSLKMKPTIIK